MENTQKTGSTKLIQKKEANKAYIQKESKPQIICENRGKDKNDTKPEQDTKHIQKERKRRKQFQNRGKRKKKQNKFEKRSF